MRQIKFRALCNVDCKEGDNITKMVYFSQLELDNGLWFNPDDENIHHINEWSSEPMQFTGLTDKNGVEIYENMILNKTFVIKYLKHRYVLFYISNMSKFEEIFNYENELEITGEYSEI